MKIHSYYRFYFLNLDMLISFLLNQIHRSDKINNELLRDL